MEKINFISLSKSPYRSEYTFRKEQQMFEFVRNFLIDLGFEESRVNSFGRPIDKNTEEAILDKEESIDNYVDRIDNFGNDVYSVDIISFSEKMVLVINSREDKQKEIVEALEKYVDWRD